MISKYFVDASFSCVLMHVSCWLYMEGLVSKRVHWPGLPAGSISKLYGMFSHSKATSAWQSIQYCVCMCRGITSWEHK